MHISKHPVKEWHEVGVVVDDQSEDTQASMEEGSCARFCLALKDVRQYKCEIPGLQRETLIASHSMKYAN
jgi:hypothetical protein